MMRAALAGAIEVGWPGTTVIQAGDFPTAWAAAARGADLILSDLVMPGAAPYEGVLGIMRAAPAAPILVITGNEEPDLLLALFDLGIAGFAPKTSKSAVIEAAVRLVLAGGRYLPPQVLDLVGSRSGGPAGRAPAAVHLTTRQAEIVQRMAAGLSNKEIARELDLSPATVKVHAAAAFASLGAANRTEAVMKARAAGLI